MVLAAKAIRTSPAVCRYLHRLSLATSPACVLRLIALDACLPLMWQAMGLMLPHPSKSDTEGTLGGRNPSLEGKMACMSVAGYAACAKSNVALDAVLDEIKVGMHLALSRPEAAN